MEVEKKQKKKIEEERDSITVSQPTNQPINQPTNQPTIQTNKQTNKRPTNQPTNKVGKPTAPLKQTTTPLAYCREEEEEEGIQKVALKSLKIAYVVV